MGRKPRVVKDEEGNEKIVVELDPEDDLSIPKADEDGIVPEFVNVSAQIQQICVPNNPDATIVVDRLGILRGAQWRSFSQPSKAWGRFPFFVERVKGVVKPGKRSAWNEGGFSEEYVLEEEQALAHVNALGVRASVLKRLDRMTDNAKLILEADGKPAVDPETGLEIRGSEDRPEVLMAIQNKTRKIRDMIQEREEKIA